MNRLNRDTLIAVGLLCLVGFFFHTSFNIRTPEFERLAPGQMGPGLWPCIILGSLMVMGVIYLFQSILDHRRGEKSEAVLPAGTVITAIRSGFSWCLLSIFCSFPSLAC
ncbi:MAG: hypothetical protein QGF09_03660 [Rhodospirillales bacterium]|nr:hypothetical protein [Rhodospirillales bacterium]